MKRDPEVPLKDALLSVLRLTGQYRFRHNGRRYPEGKLAEIVDLAAKERFKAAQIERMILELKALEANMRGEGAQQ